MLVLSFIVIGCSKKNADDYLKSAEDNLKNNKVQEAVSELEGFMSEYAEHEKAPEVLAKLASVYQNRMIKNIPEQESLLKAVEFYKKVFMEYPKSTLAPTSLFMSGFILANELKKFDAAKTQYELFLEKFPKHELAESAREELKNLGLSPEEILKNKTSPSI